MTRPPKKHHFVAQAQLRHFAADPEGRFLYVFDKRTGRPFRSSILNAGSENDFNKVNLAAGEWNFEHLFLEVDARSARLVGEIVSSRSLGWLTSDDRFALADLFATQVVRTRFSRTAPRRLAEQLREAMRGIGYDPDHNPDLVVPGEAELRLGAVRAFLDRGGHAAALLRLVPALYSAEGEARFVISDHPVARMNAFPYGDEGLSSPGVLVLLPISPDLTIALHCPTIVQRYELAETAELEPEVKARMLRYRDGLRSGEPIAVDDATVLALNRHQVSQSARHLYSATDDFGFARDYLERHPKLRGVDTHVQLGQMGQGPPPRPGMPPGLQLVIFGPVDHCMLLLEELDEQGEGLTARTRQAELLARLASEKGALRAELYVDGQVRRSMGQAMVERFGDPREGWFRVVHRDPALRALAVHLDAREAEPAWTSLVRLQQF